MMPGQSLLLAVLLAALAVAGSAHEFDESSVPEPTRLAVVASRLDARIVKIGDTQRVDSNDAVAEIAAIEVRAGSGRERGVRIDLRNEGVADSLYLDTAQADRLVADLAHFDDWSARACDRGTHCTFGIARCRPTQTDTQAFCPAVYTTREGGWGLTFGTPSGNFRFPGVSSSQWSGALAMALKSLARPEN
jgi:hypothetical protein